uniref:Secreted protein n=1 Tax=Steinernema glaseri TaxID=37863 RepID=A0A1I7Y885_9BILA
MLRAVVLLVVGLVALSQTSVLDDVKGTVSDVGDFFGAKFNDFKALFADNESDLNKNVERVKDLLNVVQEKASLLEPMANDAQKETISKVKEFLSKVDQFQARMRAQTGETFEQKKTQWESLVQNIFQDGGLQNLLPLLNSAPTVAASVLCLSLPILSYFLIQ